MQPGLTFMQTCNMLSSYVLVFCSVSLLLVFSFLFTSPRPQLTCEVLASAVGSRAVSRGSGLMGP